MKLRTSTIGVTLATVVLLGTSCASRSTTASSVPPPPGPVQTGESGNLIPSGTQITVRTNEVIASRQAGRDFQGELAQDIVNSNNRVIAPKGSPVTITVYEVDSGGAVGTRTLQAGVSAITVKGKRHTVETNVVEERGREGLGRNRRTLEHVGAGAVLGTVVGAIAGGGSGAAIGAAVGAAGGAAAQVITRGSEVKITAEYQQ
jgi:hypothetical protein